MSLNNAFHQSLMRQEFDDLHYQLTVVLCMLKIPNEVA